MVEFAHQFSFMGKKSLDDYHVIIAKYEEEPECPIGLEREIIGTDVTVSKPYKQAFSTKYEKPLSFPIMLSHIDGSKFTERDIESITSWLTSPKTYRSLYFYDVNDNKSIVEYMAMFKSVDAVRISGVLGEIIGLKFQVECNAPYGYVNCRYPLEGEITINYPELQDNKGDINNNGKLDYHDLELLRAYILDGDKYRGDINADERITNIDYNLLRAYLDNGTELEEDVKGDVNEDGWINEEDLKILRAYIIGDLQTYDGKGDLNNDGVVDITDYMMLKAYLRNEIGLSGNIGDPTSQKYQADINGDGIIDIVDQVLLKRIVISNGGVINNDDIIFNRERADVNDDDAIDIIDVVEIEDKIRNNYISQKIRADVNGDGSINENDAVALDKKMRADINDDGVIDLIDDTMLKNAIIQYRDGARSSVYINNQTSELEEYVYPVIYITPHSDETNVKIQSVTDNNHVEFKNLNNYPEGIIVDCRNQIVRSQNGELIPLSDLGWGEKELPVFQKGDINGDGKIDETDLNLLRQHITGVIELSGDITDPTSEKYRADMNNDCILDLVDVTLLRNKITEYSEISYKNFEDSVYWPRLLAGTNHLIIYGQCSFKIEYKYPMKVGAIYYGD